jgi:hypothetical protein
MPCETVVSAVRAMAARLFLGKHAQCQEKLLHNVYSGTAESVDCVAEVWPETSERGGTLPL